MVIIRYLLCKASNCFYHDKYFSKHFFHCHCHLYKLSTLRHFYYYKLRAPQCESLMIARYKRPRGLLDLPQRVHVRRAQLGTAAYSYPGVNQAVEKVRAGTAPCALEVFAVFLFFLVVGRSATGSAQRLTARTLLVSARAELEGVHRVTVPMVERAVILGFKYHICKTLSNVLTTMVNDHSILN